MDIPYTIFGYKGKQVRDNLHAWIIAAFDAFRRDPRPAAVYNLGGGRYSNVSVLEAITLCEGISARRLSFAITERPRVGDHRWYVSDMAAFKADYPGWRHTVGIEEVLSRRSIGPTSTVGSRADERASAVAGHSPNLAAPPAGARSSTPTWMTGGFNWSSQHLDRGGCDGQASRMDEGVDGPFADEVAGAPSHRRDMERAFWRRIAEGLSTDDAARAIGVSTAAGVRWFRERGGMATFMLGEVSCRYLCFEEREEIALLRARAPACARSLGRLIGRRRRSRGSCGATRRLGRQARVPRIGRAVEGRSDGATAEDRQAGRQRRVARVRAAAPRRRGSPARRDCGGPDRAAVEGPQQAPASGSPVGDGVEPGADLKPAEGRFPR